VVGLDVPFRRLDLPFAVELMVMDCPLSDDVDENWFDDVDTIWKKKTANVLPLLKTKMSQFYASTVMTWSQSVFICRGKVTRAIFQCLSCTNFGADNLPESRGFFPKDKNMIIDLRVVELSLCTWPFHQFRTRENLNDQISGKSLGLGLPN